MAATHSPKQVTQRRLQAQQTMGGKPQAQEAQGVGAGWGKADKGPHTRPKGAHGKGWFCLPESISK